MFPCLCQSTFGISVTSLIDLVLVCSPLVLRRTHMRGLSYPSTSFHPCFLLRHVIPPVICGSFIRNKSGVVHQLILWFLVAVLVPSPTYMSQNSSRSRKSSAAIHTGRTLHTSLNSHSDHNPRRSSQLDSLKLPCSHASHASQKPTSASILSDSPASDYRDDGSYSRHDPHISRPKTPLTFLSSSSPSHSPPPPPLSSKSRHSSSGSTSPLRSTMNMPFGSGTSLWPKSTNPSVSSSLSSEPMSRPDNPTPSTSRSIISTKLFCTPTPTAPEPNSTIEDLAEYCSAAPSGVSATGPHPIDRPRSSSVSSSAQGSEGPLMWAEVEGYVRLEEIRPGEKVSNLSEDKDRSMSDSIVFGCLKGPLLTRKAQTGHSERKMTRKNYWIVFEASMPQSDSSRSPKRRSGSIPRQRETFDSRSVTSDGGSDWESVSLAPSYSLISQNNSSAPSPSGGRNPALNRPLTTKSVAIVRADGLTNSSNNDSTLVGIPSPLPSLTGGGREPLLRRSNGQT
ncbi:hypothetical protein BDP27DRAFT_189414 [Rhodocollybia butyracea]|uniref:Uncharacterized protein n=1 Tax=Rhodocollybia butyracea TaxID=206335 RepID=A0A9P5UBS6_9AGAR|nr:hypothetical protein BDP27DRAFT_189414 [Rhodocollybia butyracea]